MASSKAHQVLNHHNAALFSAAEGEADHPSTTALSQHHGLPGASGHAVLWWRLIQLRQDNNPASTAITSALHTASPSGGPHDTSPAPTTCPTHRPTPPSTPASPKVSILTFIEKSFDVQKYAGEGCELFLIL